MHEAADENPSGEAAEMKSKLTSSDDEPFGTSHETACMFTGSRSHRSGNATE